MEYIVIKKIPAKFSEKGSYVDVLSPYQFIIKHVKEGGVYTKKSICSIQDLEKQKMEDFVYITEAAERLLPEIATKKRVPKVIKPYASQHEEDSTFSMFDTRRKDILVSIEQIKLAVTNLQGWT